MLHLYSQPEIQLLEASAEKGFTGMSSNKILEKIEEYKTSIWWKSSEMLILSTVRITVCESCEWYPTKSLFFAINLKHPHISIHIVHTVLFTIFMVLKRRICLTIKSVIFIWISDHIISSHDFSIWFKGDIVGRNWRPVTLLRTVFSK